MTVTRFMPRQDYAVGCLKKGGGALGKNADALKSNIARKEYSFIPENSASHLGNAFITLNAFINLFLMLYINRFP